MAAVNGATRGMIENLVGMMDGMRGGLEKSIDDIGPNGRGANNWSVEFQTTRTSAGKAKQMLERLMQLDEKMDILSEVDGELKDKLPGLLEAVKGQLNLMHQDKYPDPTQFTGLLDAFDGVRDGLHGKLDEPAPVNIDVDWGEADTVTVGSERNGGGIEAEAGSGG